MSVRDETTVIFSTVFRHRGLNADDIGAFFPGVGMVEVMFMIEIRDVSLVQ